MLNKKFGKNNKEVEPAEGDVRKSARKSMKPFVLLGSLLLALVITGAIFAYTATTTTATITVTGGSTDFCTVAENTTGTASLDYTILGKHRGTIGSALLFDVDPDANYTGDLVLNVYLTNADELEMDYSSWMMRIQLTDSTGASVLGVGTPTEIISLDTPGASIEIEYGDWSGAGNFYIYCDGGSYKTFNNGWITPESPLLYAQVVQAGDHP